MRPWTEKTYDIPRAGGGLVDHDQKYQMRPDGIPVLCASARSSSSTTRRESPRASTASSAAAVFAFGNSDGDKEMLEWTAAGAAPASWASSITPTPRANGL